MIVIYRNGERQVISGWREWLFWLAAAAVIVVLGCLALGFALTLFTVAIFALPIALVLALAVMIAMSVTLAALVSLVISGFRSSLSMEQHRNRQYAADGAVEQTIARLQHDTTRALVGSGCGSAPTSYTINGVAVQVVCTGEPVGVLVQTTTPANPQAGVLLQRNVVISACTGAGACTPETATVVAKVNFPTGADGAPSGAFIQSWSVTG